MNGLNLKMGFRAHLGHCNATPFTTSSTIRPGAALPETMLHSPSALKFDAAPSSSSSPPSCCHWVNLCHSPSGIKLALATSSSPSPSPSCYHWVNSSHSSSATESASVTSSSFPSCHCVNFSRSPGSLQRSGFKVLSTNVPARRPFHQGGKEAWRSSVNLSSRGVMQFLKSGSCRPAAVAASAAEIEKRRKQDEEEEEDSERRRSAAYRCVSQVASKYNQIVILEAPKSSSSQYAGSRVLLLDNSGNVHSIYKPDSPWTGLYWDEFASLPAIIPDGPVALFGLGGGTAARLILKLWPFLQVEGYELDEILVDQARLHLGLADLERPTREGGCLNVHVGDALSPAAAVDGGYAGIIVDLFTEGEVVSELQLPETWVNLQRRLRPGGRVMVNCGGECVEKGDPKTDVDDGTWTWEDGGGVKDATLLALATAFKGKLNCRTMDSDADNCLALTGPLPNLNAWSIALPDRLKAGALSWRPYI